MSYMYTKLQNCTYGNLKPITDGLFVDESPHWNILARLCVDNCFADGAWRRSSVGVCVVLVAKMPIYTYRTAACNGAKRRRRRRRRRTPLNKPHGRRRCHYWADTAAAAAAVAITKRSSVSNIGAAAGLQTQARPPPFGESSSPIDRRPAGRPHNVAPLRQV